MAIGGDWFGAAEDGRGELSMKMLDEGTPNPQGAALVDELAWIHGIIRENLAAIRAMAAQVVAGVPAEQLQAELRWLAATNVVWTLRTGCLRYCRLLHM